MTSLAAMAAADLVRRCGARITFVLSALLGTAAIGTIALAASQLVAVLLAAAAFGATYNMLAAITVLWGARIYTDRPSTGVAIATGAQGIGLLCGPVAGGLLAQSTSLTTALLAGATVLAAAALFAPRNTPFQEQAH